MSTGPIPMLRILTNNANPIYTLCIPGRKGVIGMTPCPGIRLESARRGNVQKNLRRDLAACQQWGASGIVTFNETDEPHGLGVGDLGDQVLSGGMWWRQMPISDMDIPEDSFEDNWAVESKQIITSLVAGERVVLHCLAGLGRTGMMAARLLVDMGMAPALAVAEVRKVRPRAIQTDDQEKYIYEHSSRGSRWTGDQTGKGPYATTPRGSIRGLVT